MLPVWGLAAMILSTAPSGVPLSLPVVPYGIGSWPEPGFGNHRAVVHVDAAAPAVRVRIPWRRRDRQPEAKDVRVYDGAGARVTDVARIAVTRGCGDLAFRAPRPGDYFVYYLPYNPGVSNFDDPGTYFRPQETADPAWLRRHGLTQEGIRTGRWRALPEAQTTRIEARSHFHRMDPMEIVATDAERAGLLAAHPGARYLLFPEDRANAIRMPDDLPVEWVARGPSAEFSGSAQPGEWYPFQVGVWAARSPIRDVAVTFAPLQGGSRRTIQAEAFTCYNLSGSDWLGRPVHPRFAVPRGMVRPLWIGVRVPDDARGGYVGTLTVKPAGLPPTVVTVRLNVAGPRLRDHGVSDLWRLSRLEWLNSRLGLGDEVVPPYTPLQVTGDAVACLGRVVRFGALGLPESVSSKGREVLAAPMRLVVDLPGGPASLAGATSRYTLKRPGAVQRAARAQAGGLEVATRTRMEFDGCVQVTATLRAAVSTDVRDVRLEMPLRRTVAAYMMGMGRRGGFRPPEFHWKWNIDHADNQLWLGDPDGGLQLMLQGDRDVWDTVSLRQAGLPASWCNGGRGGCDVTEEGDRVVVRATSGPRRLEPGKPVTFRFRLLVTPFKPLDPRHWNWRYGGLGGGMNDGGNILHIHHAQPENPYINYPFLEVDKLTKTIHAVRSTPRRVDPGQLTYPAAGNIDLRQGALHLWLRLRFDPTAGRPRDPSFNQPLFSLALPGEDELALYWNVDVRGMRAYTRVGPLSRNTYPTMVDAPAPEWRQSERHLVTVSWGAPQPGSDAQAGGLLRLYIDGKLRAEGPYRGVAADDLRGAVLAFTGSGFGLEGVRVDSAPWPGGEAPTPAVAAGTLLLDTFAGIPATGGKVTRPERSAAGTAGKLDGTVRVSAAGTGRELRLSYREVPGKANGVNLYYTVRELSNHVVEMWALRSLGAEVFQTGSDGAFKVGEATFGQEGGGYPWLKEHLVAGYVPAWRQPLPDGDHDAAIATQGLSRWHNYYLEGMRWLMEHTGLDGLYLDGIGYDREIMRRLARVMVAANPNSRINYHSGNDYDFQGRRTSPANFTMEHLPYISNLWFGEMYDYDRSPDYWLVEISGIPFGLTSEMLNYENGGNAYRGMVYGMTGRQHPSAPAMWRFWDAFGIQTAEWLGYWSPRCPVHTDNPDVLATVYRKRGRALIALASWAKGDTNVRLRVDWQALGLDPARARLTAPAIDHFQDGAMFRPTDAIPVPKGKGWLLIVE